MKCPSCQKEQTIIVRLFESGQMSQNETEICENPHCSLYVDFKKIRNWTIKYRPKKSYKGPILKK